MPKIKDFFNKSIFYWYYAAMFIFYFVTRKPGKPFDDQAVTYSVVIGIVFAVLYLTKNSPISLFGLRLENLKGRMFLWILPFILFNNGFLFVLDHFLLGEEFSVRPFDVMVLLRYLFSLSHIRTFGEEMIFRGFLLSRTISSSRKLFWTMNIFQAAVFTFLHALIPMPLTVRLVFCIFVFLFSITIGLLNQRFNSLFPSWLIHSTNGILINFILMKP